MPQGESHSPPSKSPAENKQYYNRLKEDVAGCNSYLDAPPGASPWKYDAIGHGDLRLVRLLPGEEYAPVRCELEAVALNDAPNFEALSYHWGEQYPPAYITVRDHDLAVTRNLKLALAYLRHSEQVRCLWIDAICINQKDDLEKAKQVALMRNVYQKACQTIAWIGPDPSRGETCLNLESRSPRMLQSPISITNLRAFDLCERIVLNEGDPTIGIPLEDHFRAFETSAPSGYIERIKQKGAQLTLRALVKFGVHYTGQSFRNSTEGCKAVYDEAIKTVSEGSSDVGCGRTQGLLNREQAPRQYDEKSSRDSATLATVYDMCLLNDFYSLAYVLRRPWFRRVWILQEVAVSAKVIIQCGPMTIGWGTFSVAIVILQRIAALTGSNYMLDITDTILTDVVDIIMLRKAVQSREVGMLTQTVQRDLELASLVKRYCRWQATDPRDKIYALVGLATPGKSEFDIDYRRSIRDTYLKFASEAVTDSGSLHICTISALLPHHASDLPTWVPDWTILTAQLDLLTDTSICTNGDTPIGGGDFAASGQSGTGSSRICGALLHARGLLLGRVSGVAGAMDCDLKDVNNAFMFNVSSGIGKEGVQYAKNCLAISRIFKEWETMVRSQCKDMDYLTGEDMVTFYHGLINFGVNSPEHSDGGVAIAFQKWLSSVELIRNGLTAAEKFGLFDEWRTANGKWALFPSSKRVCRRLKPEHWGLSQALSSVRDANMLKQIYSAVRSISDIAKLAWWFENNFRKQSKIWNDPLVCILNRIHQRRLARLDNGMLAMLPKQARVLQCRLSRGRVVDLVGISSAVPTCTALCMANTGTKLS